MFFKMYVVTYFMAFTISIILGANCPSGGQIYASGISEQGKIDVVTAHNKYRQQIMNGLVVGQPKGKNLLMMEYDVIIGNKAREVSNTCNMSHIFAKDDRWKWVGQNIRLTWSTSKITDQNWAETTTKWFNEHNYFIYPDKNTGNVTDHYTQVVWALSKWIGCDFISFYDYNRPSHPYSTMYTCNYGPGGNYNNQVPYLLA